MVKQKENIEAMLLNENVDMFKFKMPFLVTNLIVEKSS
jgi:hypothetical protein